MMSIGNESSRPGWGGSLRIVRADGSDLGQVWAPTRDGRHIGLDDAQQTRIREEHQRWDG
jgi:hypothetical protein